MARLVQVTIRIKIGLINYLKYADDITSLGKNDLDKLFMNINTKLSQLIFNEVNIGLSI